MTTKVVWAGLDPHILSARGYWDQAILEDLFAGHVWVPPGMPEWEHTENLGTITPASVVIIHGAHHRNRIRELKPLIDRARPSPIVITEDEGSLFPWRELNAEHCPLWIQNPRGDKHDGTERPLPVGWSPGTRAAVLAAPLDKPLDWFFAGQITTSTRRSCATQMRTMPNGELLETKAFLNTDPAAHPHETYMAKLCSAKIAPCPGGVITPDSFRVWESLEAGCIPLVDINGGRGEVPGYWQNLLRCEIPFPLVSDWAQMPGLVANMLDGWPWHANRIGSWWRGWKRDFAYRFFDDLRACNAEQHHRPGDRLTVLMPTSPIPSHPSTAIIEQTLASIRERPELAGCEVIVMCDGIRDQQSERKADYQEYIRRLLRICSRYQNVLPLVFDEHTHQAAMTKEALKRVRTPAVMFVEHDAPIIGEIPFEKLIDAVLSGGADLVRLHHEAQVLDVHQYLMLDKTPQDVCGAPLLRTVQWSQRPHVASTGFYRRILEEHFDLPREKWMIEDRMYSVVETAWRRFAEAGWHRYRLWMYAPEGNIKRSTHLNGREGDFKWVDQ